MNILPVALAAVTAKVFGSASVALVRTTFTAPPSERYADLGLALIALATVGIVIVVAVVFCNLMLIPGWKHRNDTIEIHPDRLLVVEDGTSREIPWERITADPSIRQVEGTHGQRLVPVRMVVVPVQDQEPVRIPDGHLQFREIAAAIAKARTAHAARQDVSNS
ncbi:MAG: hypothetical protein ACOVT5_14950 [Armatimonadaceae bacterium]